MQLNKKIISIAVIAVLTLSMFAFAAPAFAMVNSGAGVWLTSASATPVGDISTATVGQRIQVIGAAPNATANPGNTVNIYFDTISSATLLGTVGTGASGAFAINVTIPATTYGPHNIVVSDGAAPNLFQPLSVTTKLVASVTPSTGATVRALPGDSVTLTGSGYAANSAVAITFTGATPGTFTAPTVTTNVNGSFTVVITIPSDAGLDSAPYTLTATDAASNMNTASVTISHYVTVTPSGMAPSSPVPPGITITIAGRIKADTAFAITIDGVSVYSSTTGADGRFSTTYTLPALIGVATHSINVVATGLTPTIPTASLRTGATPVIEIQTTSGVSSASGVAGSLRQVATTGGAFVANANITLTFGSTIVNSTASDSRFGPTNTAGAITGAQFVIPALDPGTYTVTVVDQYGASATTTFTITAAAQTTITTASSFVQGDTIAFTIMSTDVTAPTPFSNVRLTVKDQAGNYWFGTPVAPITWVPAPTTAAATTLAVTFQAQVDLVGNHLILPANAPTGSWNWTILYDSNVGLNQKVTALFTVSAGGIGGLNTKLDTLQTSINNVQGNLTAVSGDVAIIKTSVGTSLATSVSNLQATVTSIQSGIASITAPNLGAITTSLDAISAKLNSVSDTTATLSTSLGEVTTTLDSLNTVVCGIDEDVLTVNTAVGSLSGNITAINGNIATVQTALGSMQVDISGIQSGMSAVQADANSAADASNNLSPLIIVAIVLALIAAISAIASIVLMRRKIAG
jgi:prefoldin subunit 5